MSNQPKILLVDDDPSLLSLLRIRLNSAGYGVETADSGERALARLPVCKPHLVITDLRMDGMDGMALFKVIHAKQPTLPVVILTAHGTIPDAVEATCRGVFGYLTKPFDSKELLDCVAKGLQVGVTSSHRQEASGNDAWQQDIITRSTEMESLFGRVGMVAKTDTSVLIQGDSGVGKELVARAIHRAGARSEKPFIAMNCTAIPESLLESELFGHTKGSFTGATREREGLFMAANGGTLFLDEIGDMPLSFQATLLRALQEKEVRPVGSSHTVPVDVRILSATHRDLEKAVENSEFREDLYYRLNVVSLQIPPLADRREDIPLLAEHFLAEFQDQGKRKIKGFAPEAMDLLVKAPWPGNVRQLRNVVEQTMTLCPTPIIPASLVQSALRESPPEMLSLSEARDHFERDYLVSLLQTTQGNVSHAARLAQRERSKFYKLLRRHELDPDSFRASHNREEEPSRV